MYGIFCQRLGLRKLLFVDLGIYQSAGRLLPFGGRAISSDAGGHRLQKEKKQKDDVEAFQTYLVSSFGLSPEKAENVSRANRSAKPGRADAVLKVLRDHGFDDVQVSKLVKKVPQVMFLNAEKIILPKMQFFSSIGMKNEDLSRIVTANPALLTRSLEKSLVPKLEFLKTLLVDNNNVIQAIKSSPWIFFFHCDRNLAPNVTALREAGVPPHVLQNMMKHFASVVIQSRAKFGKCFDEVSKMGFHPRESVFIEAMHVFSSTLKASRDRKIDILRQCGMSQSEIQDIIKKCPRVLLVSDEKLTRNMEYLVKEMHYSPFHITLYPLTLLHGTENRIIPRCSVVRLLQSKGLLRKDVKLSFLRINDKAFYDKYVAGYLCEFPQLLDVYRGKMSSLDLNGTKQQEC